MQNERRRQEASGLRHLFHEQWEHLSRLIDRYQTERRERTQQKLIETHHIESVVNGTNGSMRAVMDYKRQLRLSVRGLIDYVENLVEQLPAPLHVSEKRFILDPQVRGLFVRKQAISEIFGRCDDLRDFFAAAENRQCQQAYAILFLQRQEKSILGMELQGETIVRDVKQTQVNFAQHKIVIPCRSEQELRSALKTLLFDSFVVHVKSHLARIGRTQIESLHHKPGLSNDNEVFEYIDLENPEVYLRELTRFLQTPQKLLRLEQDTICLDPMQIKGSCQKQSRLRQIHLQEILMGKDSKRVICLVSYPRDELPAKKDLLAEAEAVLGPF